MLIPFAYASYIVMAALDRKAISRDLCVFIKHELIAF